MKNFLLILSLIVTPIFVFSQVGIGTDIPTKMLDVNGEMRVRTVLAGNTRAAPDSILVVNGQGVVQFVPSSRVISSPDLISFVRGKASTATVSILSLDLFSGWKKIKFDAEDLDVGNDYDAVTDYSFTARKAGIYHIYVHYTLGEAVLAVSGSTGVGIMKQSGATTTLLAEDSSSLLSVVLVGNVSSPLRQVQTIAKLETGDKIYFAINSDLNISVLSGDGNPSRTFFTIHQVQ